MDRAVGTAMDSSEARRVDAARGGASMTQVLRCSGCGTAMPCGARASSCWCSRWPALPTGALASEAGCLCDVCLGDRLLAARAPLPATADDALLAAIDAAIAGKTMPAGALGRVQGLARTIAAVQRTVAPRIERCAIAVFAGDHGIVDEGVSAYPRDVTWQMVENMLAGGAAISVFARAHDIALTVVDAGVAHEFGPRDGLVDAKVAPGTANFALGPAMSPGQARAALAHGLAIGGRIGAAGCDAFGAGEMGIGNTSSAAALLALLLGRPVAELVGRGTGVDDAALARKRSVLEAAVARHRAAHAPLEALAAVGGFEIGMMAGAFLGAAARGAVIVVDGFIATAAWVLAARIDPALAARSVFAHASAEQGHAAALRAVGAEPLLTLDLRLGEGTGAALAMPLLRAAAAMLAEMASFESAGVSRSGTGAA